MGHGQDPATSVWYSQTSPGSDTPSRRTWEPGKRLADEKTVARGLNALREAIDELKNKLKH
jgi:hypothetical protein